MSKARLDRWYGPFSNFARFSTIEEQFLFTFRLPSPKEVIPFLKEEDTRPPTYTYTLLCQVTGNCLEAYASMSIMRATRQAEESQG